MLKTHESTQAYNINHIKKWLSGLFYSFTTNRPCNYGAMMEVFVSGGIHVTMFLPAQCWRGTKTFENKSQAVIKWDYPLSGLMWMSSPPPWQAQNGVKRCTDRLNLPQLDITASY